MEIRSFPATTPFQVPAPQEEHRTPVLERVRDTVMIGSLMGAPAAGGAAFGLPGFAAGLAASGAFVALSTDGEERRILLPLTLMAGGVLGVAGLLGGWVGTAVVAGLGGAYGWVCSG